MLPSTPDAAPPASRTVSLNLPMLFSSAVPGFPKCLTENPHVCKFCDLCCFSFLCDLKSPGESSAKLATFSFFPFFQSYCDSYWQQQIQPTIIIFNILRSSKKKGFCKFHYLQLGFGLLLLTITSQGGFAVNSISTSMTSFQSSTHQFQTLE